MTDPTQPTPEPSPQPPSPSPSPGQSNHLADHAGPAATPDPTAQKTTRTAQPAEAGGGGGGCGIGPAIDVEVLPGGWHRAWSPLGAEHLRAEHERLERHLERHLEWRLGPYDQDAVRARLAEEFDRLTWITPSTPIAMSPGLLIQAILPQIPFTGGLNAFAVGSLSQMPLDGDLSDLNVIGLDGVTATGRQRLYLLDLFTHAISLALDIAPDPTPTPPAHATRPRP